MRICIQVVSCDCVKDSPHRLTNNPASSIICESGENWMNGAVGYLQIISAAVTPVVMISAAAALIIGINQKHVAIMEALRALTNEYRDEGTTEKRRTDIQEQVPLFMQRLRYTATGHRWLYASEVCFVATVLIIIMGMHNVTADRVAIGLFFFVILVGLTTSLLGYDSLLLKAWDGLTTWPGPFSIFNARWMLIDV